MLTVENPSVPTLDTALLKDIPEGVKIYHAHSLEPSYASKQTFSNADKQQGIKVLAKKYITMMLLPDLQILWWPGLVAKLIKAIKTEKPDCLFVTAPPFSSFIPVVVLGKLFGIPVLLDYRDEWVSPGIVGKMLPSHVWPICSTPSLKSLHYQTVVFLQPQPRVMLTA